MHDIQIRLRCFDMELEALRFDLFFRFDAFNMDLLIWGVSITQFRSVSHFRFFWR